MCAFDGEDIAEGEFAGVEGVGKYGYPYFRNRCFVLARSGTKAETVAELKKLYDDILANDEMSSWLAKFVSPLATACAASAAEL